MRSSKEVSVMKESISRECSSKVKRWSEIFSSISNTSPGVVVFAHQ